MPSHFRVELRRLRLLAGLSLKELGERIDYTKGHLSKIESGERRPTPQLARRCDAALKAGGALMALADQGQPGRPDAPGRESAHAEWELLLSGDGVARFTALAGNDPVRMTFAPAPGDLDAQGALLNETIRFGQSASPGMVLPVAIFHVQALRSALPYTKGRSRMRLLRLAARAAEFTGWMAQECGDDAAARWWTDRAVEFAQEGGDRELVEYADVRRALTTLYQGKADPTVRLAERVRSLSSLPPRVRWLAALREAQGHAMAVNDHGFRTAVDHAHTLWERSAREAPPPRPAEGFARPLGTSVPVDVMTTMVTGWCLHDLGRPDEAAEILGGALAGLAPGSRRSRVRFAVRRAVALAEDGDLTRGCALMSDMLDDIRVVDSATVRFGLRAFRQAVRRRRADERVAALWPELQQVTEPYCGWRG
ncbi:Helix-turn-helix domain-containing protein [Sinosporangium album]|uniref:Helix-turn-helix domain-containing protein n=1 Tax=Sinosporangium album TaxID=504805 RepID=A0A1G8B1T3_9ACTN|nr:helix-turn-helix transcriptional regulator [Sinosporangium album]SDH27222.1 Helix-turn-helix domain-containing protein [Sinosporangium album]